MVIYLAGAVLTFALCKIFRGNKFNESEDKWITLGLTIFSWVGFGALAVIALYCILKDEEKEI